MLTKIEKIMTLINKEFKYDINKNSCGYHFHTNFFSFSIDIEQKNIIFYMCENNNKFLFNPLKKQIELILKD